MQIFSKGLSDNPLFQWRYHAAFWHFYMLLVNKNSHLFTKVVMDAFRGGFIQPTQASSLLNTQINNFSKLEAFLHK